tara:strand:+ start:1936 stop:2142 length:207 start_codon:yes stop_codon:yes gene_type:complete
MIVEPRRTRSHDLTKAENYSLLIRLHAVETAGEPKSDNNQYDQNDDPTITTAWDGTSKSILTAAEKFF